MIYITISSLVNTYSRITYPNVANTEQSYHILSKASLLLSLAGAVVQALFDASSFFDIIIPTHYICCASLMPSRILQRGNGYREISTQTPPGHHLSTLKGKDFSLVTFHNVVGSQHAIYYITLTI